MRLKFKNQKFQADAAKAVCDVFEGQPRQEVTYQMDRGAAQYAQLVDDECFVGYLNTPIVHELSDAVILENIQKIQRAHQIAPSGKIESKGSAAKFNLTVEMETGVGKTYTYIKTMFELNKRYGWTKFIIVVPSVAIREGVFKSFQVTRDHFMQDYQDAPCKTIDFFIYDSNNLTAIDDFANSSGIKAMIINSQGFNSRKEEARRIFKKLDAFRSRKPIDVIKRTNPILIIDEPQSVEGSATKDQLALFNPLFMLRYSATHKADSVYNMVYRLDAMEAYNKKLVKKIAVKGISISGSTGTEGYLYLESINLSKGAPTATIEFETKGSKALRKIRKTVGEGFNLYENSGDMSVYKTGYTIVKIDGRDNSVELSSGKKIYAGCIIGAVNPAHLRRIQIRETILSHIERERELFAKGIKVLSLFFIDEVKNYRTYEGGNKANGIYADIFEEEYNAILDEYQASAFHGEYEKWLLDESRAARTTHEGYFSIDKNKQFVDSKIGDKKEKTSDDAVAYDLIMKDKERLLSRSEPVRFIFSHSALREGWDNPNVFQICTLKDGKSEVRKRQEVGRGLRLSVNQDGERMDVSLLGESVHDINILTVIASESYDSFAKELQTELADCVAYRPRKVEKSLFEGKVIKDKAGNEEVIDGELAQIIYESLIENDYVRKGQLTDKYYADKKSGGLEMADEIADSAESIVCILDSIYNPAAAKPDDARANNVELKVRDTKLQSKEFKELWARISGKSAYVVDFSSAELIEKAVQALNDKLRISKVRVHIEQGELDKIKSKEGLKAGAEFKKKQSRDEDLSVGASSSVKYDLVGKLAAETKLTRSDIVKILNKVDKVVIKQFENNPEEFIIQAAELIRDEIATVVIRHIKYNKLTQSYDTSLFTEPSIKGKLGINAMTADRHLFDHVKYDSDTERKFAENLETRTAEVAVYIKLPSGFYINTPVGKYNPDWAIAFHEGSLKHIYFVAETKGTMQEMQLREIELAKEHCAQEHFHAISGADVKFKIISTYDELLKIVKG
jgi:type III restriction enzyme